MGSNDAYEFPVGELQRLKKIFPRVAPSLEKAS
jgi:hypothetical protein